MEQNQVTPSALERRIDIAVSLADIEKEVDARLKRMARTVKMPGFRPGKVPMKIVAQTHGGQARGEAVGAAVEKAFGEKVRADNLRVAGYPQIQPKEAAAEGTLEFTAVFEVYPVVAVGEFVAGADHHHAQVVFRFEAAGLGPHFEHRQAGGVVDVDRGVGEHAGGAG